MTAPIEMFKARAEARALLWQSDYLDFHEAVDELQLAAAELGLTTQQDEIQRIIAEAFAAVRDDVAPATEPLPAIAPTDTAQSTLDAAAWLWFQRGEPERFRRFLHRHADRDCAAILQHIQNIRAKRHARNT